MLETGLKGTQSTLVTEEKTAHAVESGMLSVFATPMLAALMEKTAAYSAAPHLQAGQGTVGSRLDIRHTAPTPVGMTVVCESELIEIDGRRLVFSITARDEAGEIGSALHERFIIDNEKFMAKVSLRKKE